MQKVVKPAYAAKIAVDGLRAQPFIEQIIDIGAYVLIGNRFNGDVQPQHEQLDAAHVVDQRVRRKTSSFKMPPIFYDSAGHIHLFFLPSMMAMVVKYSALRVLSVRLA